jgi:DNA invertase Pin-like site-specific DNA recombinase
MPGVSAQIHLFGAFLFTQFSGWHQKTTLGQSSNTRQTSTSKQSYVEQLSWEYLMPTRKERAAGYPHCSDENLYDSPTLDSQAKAIRTHCQKEGYEITDDHMYPEAMTAYLLPYTQRPKLMELLAAAKRREFDVLVVTEVRAISRRQVEVFVIYDMLQKYGVRIETIQEKFEDSAIGRFILATRAMVAGLERENTYMRCQRGKRDRVEAGNLNGHAHPTYGYVFVDTDKEVKARYDLNNKVIYVDANNEEWTEIKVVRYIFDLAREGVSITRIARTLNELGLPTPKNLRNIQKPIGRQEQSTLSSQTEIILVKPTPISTNASEKKFSMSPGKNKPCFPLVLFPPSFPKRSLKQSKSSLRSISKTPSEIINTPRI